MKRPLIIGAAVLLLAFAGIMFARRGGSGAGSYQTGVMSRGPVTQAVTATGTLNPVVNVQVGSQISGQIQKLFADFNSPVTASQVLAQIDPAVYQANVAQAEGEVANARAGLDLARVECGADAVAGCETKFRAG